MKKNKFLEELSQAFKSLTYPDFIALSRVVDLIKQAEDYWLYLRFLSYICAKGSKIYRTEEIFKEICTMKDERGENYPGMPYINAVLLWLKEDGLIAYPKRPSEHLTFDVDVSLLFYKWKFSGSEDVGNVFFNQLNTAFTAMTFGDLKVFTKVDKIIKYNADHLLLLRTLSCLASKGSGQYTPEQIFKEIAVMRSRTNEAFPSMPIIEGLIEVLKNKQFINFPTRQNSKDPYLIDTSPLFSVWGFPDNGSISDKGVCDE